MVIRFTTPREIEMQRAEEHKKIEEFWRCFESVSADLLADTDDALLLTELRNHLNSIHPGLMWETGPGQAKRRQLTISPNLDKNLLETAKQIVSAAPALEDWEFHHARRPRKWDYKLALESDGGTPIEIDASGWVFITLYSHSGTYQVLLHGGNLPPLTKDQRWQAAEAVLVHLVGEEVVLDVIHDFGLLDTLEPLDALSTKPLWLLRETVAGAERLEVAVEEAVMSKDSQTHLRAGLGLTEPGICQCAEDAPESARSFGKGSQAVVNFVYSFLSLCFRVDCWLWPRHGRDIPTVEVLPWIQRKYYAEMQEIFDEPAEELRRLTLSKADFRRSQIRQIRLALDCIASTQEKAEVMQRWGRSEALNGREEGDIYRERAARTLIEFCLEYRAFAFCVLARLRLWQTAMGLLPFVCVPSIGRLQTTTPYPEGNTSERRRGKGR